MKKYWPLGLVVLFFLVTRIFNISQIPVSVYWDEASIGYNAYSVATDLKDEWGSFLPIHFRAFGEFKLPVYIYSVAAFVKLIGLNEYAVRLPAVFYSLGVLIVVYLLTKKITGKESVSVLASFILAVSPWLFIFSRTGYEATAGLFFYLLSIYLFIINPKKKLLFFGGVVSLIASMYSYTSFRIFTPPTLLISSILFLKNEFRKRLPVAVLSLVLFAASLIPIARLFIYDAGFQRAQTFALIPGFQQVYDLAGKPHFQITYNRWQGVNWWENVATIGKNYLSHFSPGFLFMKGDTNSRSQVPGHGQLYLLDLPLILLGLAAVFKSKKILYYIPLVTLLIAPIPASITKESPHALRTLLAVPSFAMLSAFGVGFLIDKFKKCAKIIIAVAAVGYLLFFGVYFNAFLTSYPGNSAKDWQYSYKEIFMNQKSGQVTSEFGQPYIFALYYQKYSPSNFRSTVKYNPPDKWGFSTVASFGQFEFK